MTNHQAVEEALDALAKLHHSRAVALARSEAEAAGRCGCCGGFLRGSDHCACCGCEEFESECDHTCDGHSCSFDHTHDGRDD